MVSTHGVFPEAYIKKQASLGKTSTNSIRDKLIFIINQIEDQLLIRKHVKNFVMCQNYAQQNKGRSEYIHTYFIEPLVALDVTERFTSKDNRFLASVSFALAQWIEKNYKECFPELDEFCSIVRTKINHEKPLVLTLGDKVSGKFEIQQIKYETLRTPKPLFSDQNKKKRYSELSYFVPTNKPDKKQASQAIAANYTHFLDSRLCGLVIIKAMEKGVILWTNHDCFYTHESNLDIIKELYFESYLELIINNNALTNFFNSNETKNIPTVNKFLSKINSNLNEIISDIETGRAVMCEFILS